MGLNFTNKVEPRYSATEQTSTFITVQGETQYNSTVVHRLAFASIAHGGLWASAHRTNGFRCPWQIVPHQATSYTSPTPEPYTVVNLKLDLFSQASCKKKLHLPLLKSAFFKKRVGRWGGGGGGAKIELNSWTFALWSKLKAITCHNLWNFQFFGHNVPINCLKLFGVRKRNKALDQNFP